MNHLPDWVYNGGVLLVLTIGFSTMLISAWREKRKEKRRGSDLDR